MMTENIPVVELDCQRCGHKWIPRKSRVNVCPKCKSALWDVKKQKEEKNA